MSDLRLGLFDLPEFGDRLMPPARPRLNKNRPLWRPAKSHPNETTAAQTSSAKAARFMRVINRAPEVMVKVTGVNRDAKSLTAHLKYLVRTSADAEIEDESRSAFVGEYAEMHRLTREWGVATAENEIGENGRRRPVAALHIVLSMPKGTNPQTVLAAARGFADEELANHRHLLVLHHDKEHPHVHVVVNNVGYDLKPLARDREDLQRWRETFARELRQRGVEAEATPRKMRGVIQKPSNRKVSLAAQRSKNKYGDFREARVYAGKVRDALKASRGLRNGEIHPAEIRARENRTLVERALVDAIEKLNEQGEMGRIAAAKVARFVATLPPAVTELEMIQREIKQMGIEQDLERVEVKKVMSLGRRS